jgi:DNA-binding transcriptional MerR regulator
MAKAKGAFRTISEVAEWLDTPTHVLRFWETKFSQIKPVKGAGGRRYYRPADMELLCGIKKLLHKDGLTIKGTQKLLREKGVKHVTTLGASMTQANSAPVAGSETPKPILDLVIADPVVVNPVVAEPEPASTVLPTQDMFPFVHAGKGPAVEINIPTLPDALPDLPGRLIGCVPTDATALSAKARQITLLLNRLEVLRDRMRG